MKKQIEQLINQVSHRTISTDEAIEEIVDLCKTDKYHFAREMIFTLRTCQAISPEVYLHWITKLLKEEHE